MHRAPTDRDSWILGQAAWLHDAHTLSLGPTGRVDLEAKSAATVHHGGRGLCRPLEADQRNASSTCRCCAGPHTPPIAYAGAGFSK
jgi:hypothetical protein